MERKNARPVGGSDFFKEFWQPNPLRAITATGLYLPSILH